jgi:hypothetical protein
MAKYRIATFTQIDRQGGQHLFYGSRPEEYAMAILGLGSTPLGDVVVYDEETLVELEEASYAASCSKSDHTECDHWTEAVEFVGTGNQPWVGDHTYMIIPRQCEEHDMLSIACPCPLSTLDPWGENRAAEAEKRGIAAPHEGEAA